MRPGKSTNVFVSYSHADALLVSPVVRLLRVNKSLVFQDIDGIQPGKRWQGEIAKALAESHLVVVFWCNHASQSNEVSKEWQAAIEQKKDLLPLLLDTTPLPPELAEFQWIDFRGTVGANHSSIGLRESTVQAEAATPSIAEARAEPMLEPARSSTPRLLLAACATFLGVAAFLGWFYWLKSVPLSKGTPPLATPAPTPPRWAARLDLGLSTLLLLGIIFAVTVCLIWLLRSHPLRSPLKERVLKRVIEKWEERPPGNIERHIASELEAEILRRTTLRRGTGR